MTDHTSRILNRILSEIELYEKDQINEKNLMRNLEPHISAIEESHIRDILNNFIIKIEESLYLFDLAEGKAFLLDEIHKLKNNPLFQKLGS